MPAFSISADCAGGGWWEVKGRERLADVLWKREAEDPPEGVCCLVRKPCAGFLRELEPQAKRTEGHRDTPKENHYRRE